MKHNETAYLCLLISDLQLCLIKNIPKPKHVNEIIQSRRIFNQYPVLYYLSGGSKLLKEFSTRFNHSVILCLLVMHAHE